MADTPEQIALATPVDSASASEQFVAPAPTSTDVPTGEIYPMLARALRELDETGGGDGFLGRYLQRPATLWQRWNQKLWRLPRLVDYRKTPLEALKHLRAHVGFGAGSRLPDAVASRLNELNLRRLVKLAVPFWQKRGRRSAIVDAIRTLCGVRPAVYDWHWLQPLLGEVVLGEEGTPNHDLRCLYTLTALVPAGTCDGAGQVWFRVPDLDGLLDRQLVMDLCSLARPVGERYEVAFVHFSDTFLDGRLSHWVKVLGTTSEVTAGDSGTVPVKLAGMEVAEGTVESVVCPLALTWKDYTFVATIDIRHVNQQVIVRFLWDGTLNGDRYYVTIAPSDPTPLKLASVVLGVGGIIHTQVPAEPILPGLRVLRIVTTKEGGQQLVRVYLDGVIVLEKLSVYALAAGTVGLEVVGATGLKVRFSAVEVFQQGLDVRVLAP